jgi:hypothetical protein
MVKLPPERNSPPASATAPRRIVAHELRASDDARRPLGVSGFPGEGNNTRSVAVPLWVKQEIDGWLDVAGIEKGPIFRRVLANGRVGKHALTERAVWQLVREYAAQIGIGALAPHDRMICGARRRSSAARRAGSSSKFSFCSGMSRF